MAGRKFLVPRYYGQRAVFATLRALFFHFRFFATCGRLSFRAHVKIACRIVAHKNPHRYAFQTSNRLSILNGLALRASLLCHPFGALIRSYPVLSSSEIPIPEAADLALITIRKFFYYTIHNILINVLLKPAGYQPHETKQKY